MLANRSEKYLSGFFRIFAAGLLLGALWQQPYGYYTFTRWVVFGACVITLWLTTEWSLVKTRPEKRVWPWIIGGIGFLFNPILHLYISREMWQFYDILAATLLLISISSLSKKYNKPEYWIIGVLEAGERLLGWVADHSHPEFDKSDEGTFIVKLIVFLKIILMGYGIGIPYMLVISSERPGFMVVLIVPILCVANLLSYCICSIFYWIIKIRPAKKINSFDHVSTELFFDLDSV